MYPVYHTIHDSFHFMKKFVDPKFTYHLALGRIWAQVGLTLADSVILSFNFTRLAWRLNLCVENVENAYKEKLAYNIISLGKSVYCRYVTVPLILIVDDFRAIL